MTLASIKLGVVASALGDDPRQVPKVARSLGFAGLQFDAYGRGLDLTELSGTGRREFVRMLSAQDQQLAGLRFDLGPKGFGPGADVDRVLDRLEKALEAAAGLGTPLVCVEVGILPAPQRQARVKPNVTSDQLGLLVLPTMSSAPAPVSEPGPPPDPKVVALVDAAMGELGARADRYNVVVAFRSDLSSFAAIERALLTARCPWFGIDLDPAAILSDEWTSDDVFVRLGASIRHVRGRDAVAGADRRTRTTVIGAGSVDWPVLLANLDAAEYRGWITIDPAELNDKPGAAEIGRKWIAGMKG